MSHLEYFELAEAVAVASDSAAEVEESRSERNDNVTSAKSKNLKNPIQNLVLKGSDAQGQLEPVSLPTLASRQSASHSKSCSNSGTGSMSCDFKLNKFNFRSVD